MEHKQFANNVVHSIIAQVISFLVGFLLNLVVPRFISEYSYGLWQTYVLYSSYVGILHFGLLDGIVLRYSQYDYDDLDKPILRSQFYSLLFITGFFSFFAAAYSISISQDVNRFLILLVGISIIVKNVFTYASYTFQTTNRINKYAFLIISDRLLYGIFVSILLLCENDNYVLYCCADLLSDFLAFAISIIFNKALYFGKSLTLSNTIIELKANIGSGIMLLIANWSSMFLTGSSKMFVQLHWDTLVFGKVSFAFSISNLLLQFVNAVSVVLFPSLKRMNTSELPDVYSKIRNIISPILFISILLYYPTIWLLNIWIPQYSNSFIYMGILFPVVIFTAKVSLLTNNYFKAYRQEKAMFVINVVFVLIALVFFSISTFIFDSLNALLMSTVVVLMLRSIVSELYISKLIEKSFSFDYIIELLLTCVFISTSFLSKSYIGLLLYAATLVPYIFLKRHSFKHNKGE